MHMDNNKKIIIIGFGSIGKRHYYNIKSLGYTNIVVFDVNKDIIPSDVESVDSVSIDVLINFDIAFICNPTSMHVDTLRLCVQAGCHSFIEKPLTSTLQNKDELEELIHVCKEKSLIHMVGCNLRFDPAIKKMKEMIENGDVGKVFAIYLE